MQQEERMRERRSNILQLGSLGVMHNACSGSGRLEHVHVYMDLGAEPRHACECLFAMRQAAQGRGGAVIISFLFRPTYKYSPIQSVFLF